MHKEITRLVDLIRYSDSELPEISLGFLMCVATVAPERLLWMPLLGQVVLGIIGLLRIHASLVCGLPIRNAFNIACVILYASMLGAEIVHAGPGDELFLFAVTTVATWCLYRTNYEINARIDMTKGK